MMPTPQFVTQKRESGLRSATKMALLESSASRPGMNWSCILLSISLCLVGITEGMGQTFSLKTTEAGLTAAHDGNGISVADYDQDGDLDIYFVGYRTFDAGDPLTWNRLYRNNGDGSFTDVADQAGVRMDHLPTEPSRMMGNNFGASWGDYDNDGDPDLFLTRVGREVLFRNNGDGTFADVTEIAGLQVLDVSADSVETVTSLWWDSDLDGDLDLYVSAWNDENRFYKNNGDGTFDDISASSGLNTVSRTWMVLPLDANMDGIPDLYLVNDFGANALHLGLGNNLFEDATSLFAMGDTGEGMGATTGDINNDGYFDVFLTNNSDRIETPNSLYLGSDSPPFAQVAADLGVDRTHWAWGTEFFDADQDGDLDLYVVNGIFIENSMPNLLFRNKLIETGLLDFENISDAAGVNAGAEARGLVTFDYDGDGDLDLLISNWSDALYLYENTSISGNWLQVELEGVLSNRDGYGAVVSVRTEQGTSYRVNDGADFLGQSSQPLHFGLGAEDIVLEIMVTWPSGAIESFMNVNINQTFDIREGGGISVSRESEVEIPLYSPVSIFPSPATDRATLTFTPRLFGKYHFIVYDLLGRQRFADIGYAHDHSEYRVDIPLHNFNSGVFFLKILHDETGQSITKQLVKIR